MRIPDTYKVEQIPTSETVEWLLNKHYAHRMPSVMFSFGLYDNKRILQGVMTYGMPPCHFNYGSGIFNDFTIDTYELTRLVINENLPKNTCSYFISGTFSLLPKPCCLVSFSDPNNNHHGYIYQATNWIYTGETQKGGKDKQWIWDKREYHAKTITIKWMKDNGFKYNDNLNMTQNWINNGGTIEENDLRKYRYLYLLGNKTQIKEMKKKLALPILPYPKGDNTRYDASYQPNTQELLF